MNSSRETKSITESLDQQPSADSEQSKAETPPPLIKIERVFSLSKEEFEKVKECEQTPVLANNDNDDDFLQTFSKAFNNFSKDVRKAIETTGSSQQKKVSTDPSHQKLGLLDEQKLNSKYDKESSNRRNQWNGERNVPFHSELTGHKRTRLSSVDQFVGSPSDQESSFISQLQKLHSFTDNEQDSSKKPKKCEDSAANEWFTMGPSRDEKASGDQPYHVVKSNRGLPALIQFSEKNPEQPTNKTAALLEKYKKYLILQNREPKTGHDKDNWKRQALSDYLVQLKKHQITLSENKKMILSRSLAYSSPNIVSTRTATSPNTSELNNDTRPVPKTLTDEKALQRRKKLHDMIEEIKRSNQPERQPDDEFARPFETIQSRYEGRNNSILEEKEQLRREETIRKLRHEEAVMKLRQEENPVQYRHEEHRVRKINFEEHKQDVAGMTYRHEKILANYTQERGKDVQCTRSEQAERYRQEEIQMKHQENQSNSGDDQHSPTTRSYLAGFMGRVSPDDPDLFKPRTYKRLESGKPSALQKLEDKLSKEKLGEEDEGDPNENRILKLERKRYLSRIASYKSRKKRLDREEHLSQHVEGLKEEKIRLEMMKSFASKELHEVRSIIKNHLQLGCEDKQVTERLIYSLNNFS